MIEIQYRVTEVLENSKVADKLDEISSDKTKELVRTKAFIPKKETEEQES